jgi:hypothetical protein
MSTQVGCGDGRSASPKVVTGRFSGRPRPCRPNFHPPRSPRQHGVKRRSGENFAVREQRLASTGWYRDTGRFEMK